METLDNTILVWGSNESMQFGLHLKRDLQKYYQIHSSNAVNARI
jgi:alpha-tubulin suppressor-like RCC1 family protein